MPSFGKQSQVDTQSLLTKRLASWSKNSEMLKVCYIGIMWYYKEEEKELLNTCSTHITLKVEWKKANKLNTREHRVFDSIYVKCKNYCVLLEVQVMLTWCRKMKELVTGRKEYMGNFSSPSVFSFLIRILGMLETQQESSW